MNKVAKVVTAVISVRVIVDADATEHDIIEKAEEKIFSCTEQIVRRGLKSIEDDQIYPYGTYEIDNLE